MYNNTMYVRVHITVVSVTMGNVLKPLLYLWYVKVLVVE